MRLVATIHKSVNLNMSITTEISIEQCCSKLGVSKLYPQKFMTVNTLGFEIHTVSVTITQLYQCSSKATVDKQTINSVITFK